MYYGHGRGAVVIKTRRCNKNATLEFACLSLFEFVELQHVFLHAAGADAGATADGDRGGADGGAAGVRGRGRGGATCVV